MVDAASGCRISAEIQHNAAEGGNSGSVICIRLLVASGILGEEDYQVKNPITGATDFKTRLVNRRRKWHTIVMDSRFTSLRLCTQLWKLGIEVVGTCRSNKYDWPVELSATEMCKLDVGSTRHAFYGPVTAIAYVSKKISGDKQEKKIVQLMSTMHHEAEFKATDGMTSKSSKPQIVVTYNKNKHYVDKYNQQIRSVLSPFISCLSQFYLFRPFCGYSAYVVL
jgi:Transposase IS4